MNLEGVMLSELYQADKDKHSMISFMESNNKTNEPATQNRKGLMNNRLTANEGLPEGRGLKAEQKR